MTNAPRRVAAIDCGTNTIRLLVTDVDGDAKNDLSRLMRIVRLGEGVDVSGRLGDEAIARTLQVCREFAEVIASLDTPARPVEVVRFCATSAVRDAANAGTFGDAVREVFGVRPIVLTGEQEAAASFDGATRDLSPTDAAPVAVVDLGGGSTEVVLGARGVVAWSHSFNLGSVRLTERHLHTDPPTPAEVAACVDELDGQLAPVLSGLEPARQLVGVAGTITTVAAHALALPSYDADRLHGARLPVESVRSACISLVSMTVAARRALPFMHPGRADVIGAGALVLDRVLEHLPRATDELIVGGHDILDGIAWAAATKE